MIPSTGSGLGIGGRGMHNGCDFCNWKGEVNCHFKAIFQQLGKYFRTPIMKSFVLQVQGDLRKLGILSLVMEVEENSTG